MSSWEDSRADRALDAILEDARRLSLLLTSGPAVAGVVGGLLVEGRGFVGAFLSALALAVGVALFVLFLRTRALDTASLAASAAVAMVSLLAGVGLSLIAWPGAPGAVLAVGSGIAAGARATRIARSVD